MSSGSLTGFSTEDDLNFHAFFSKGPTVIIAVLSGGCVNKGQIDSWPVLCEEQMLWFFSQKTRHWTQNMDMVCVWSLTCNVNLSLILNYNTATKNNNNLLLQAWGKQHTNLWVVCGSLSSLTCSMWAVSICFCHTKFEQANFQWCHQDLYNIIRLLFLQCFTTQHLLTALCLQCM